jgi:hypothetical protein
MVQRGLDVQVHTISEPAIVDWDSQDNRGRVAFFSDDQTTIVLSMPAELLETLQAGIARVLRDKDAPVPGR